MRARPIIKRSEKYHYFIHSTFNWGILYRFLHDGTGGKYWRVSDFVKQWNRASDKITWLGWTEITKEEARMKFPSAFL